MVELYCQHGPNAARPCVVTQKDATVIILRGPLRMSSQSFATDVQKKSAGKGLRELLLRVCPPQPVFIYNYHCTFRLGSAGRVSPHSFFSFL